MKKETVGILQIVTASFLFGFIPILVRFGTGIGIYNLSFFKILVAALCLGLLFISVRSIKLAPFKRERGKMLFFGGIHGFIILGYFFAIQYLSVASAVLLVYSSSIWIVLFSHWILKEKISKNTWIALTIAMVGVLLVLSPKDFFIRESLIGSLAGLLAGAGAGLVYTLSKTFKSYDKISLTFWQNVIALPFLLPLLLIDLPHFTGGDIWIIILLGSVCQAIPFILIFKGFQNIKGQMIAVITLLDVPFPVFFAFLFFYEIPSLMAFVGGILILLGSYLAARSQ